MALVRLGEVTKRSELNEVFRFTRADGRYLCPLLAKSGKPAQLAKLRDLLVDQTVDHLVRKWAATALGGIKDKAAAPNLKKALTDPSRHVREAAEAALSNLD
jgi:HEAT repeat protein